MPLVVGEHCESAGTTNWPEAEIVVGMARSPRLYPACVELARAAAGDAAGTVRGVVVSADRPPAAAVPACPTKNTNRAHAARPIVGALRCRGLVGGFMRSPLSMSADPQETTRTRRACDPTGTGPTPQPPLLSPLLPRLAPNPSPPRRLTARRWSGTLDPSFEWGGSDERTFDGLRRH